MIDLQQQQKLITNFLQALEKECNALSFLTRETVLFHGHLVKTHNNTAVYEFEYHENCYFVPTLSVECFIGTEPSLLFFGKVVDVKSQFVRIYSPIFLGEYIPALTCSWKPEELTETILSTFSLVRITELVKKILHKNFENNLLLFQKTPLFSSSLSV